LQSIDLYRQRAKRGKCVISHEISRRLKRLQLKGTNLRTTLGFRQEEFIQKGEVKVILKEQNAGHSGPASVRSTERDLEL